MPESPDTCGRSRIRRKKVADSKNILQNICFSVNGLKENAENLNYYPILRRKVELYLFLSTHREWERFLCRFLQMLSTAATIKVCVVYLQSSLPC